MPPKKKPKKKAPKKKATVTQVLIDMALHVGQNIGSGVTISEAAGAAWDDFYRTSVARALRLPGSNWTVDRRKALQVAELVGQQARKGALASKDQTITKAIAEAASDEAEKISSTFKICPKGGGRYCP